MTKIFVVTRKNMIMAAIALSMLAIAFIFFLNQGEAVPAAGSSGEERVIHLVTGEFSATTADGRKIEAYRWDPGTIFVKKGERIALSIFGVNGDSHPFVIEGLGIRGEVVKGEETIVRFVPDKKGIYRLICLTHTDKDHDGPMIAYIVVN